MCKSRKKWKLVIQFILFMPIPRNSHCRRDDLGGVFIHLILQSLQFPLGVPHTLQLRLQKPGERRSGMQTGNSPNQRRRERGWRGKRTGFLSPWSDFWPCTAAAAPPSPPAPSACAASAPPCSAVSDPRAPRSVPRLLVKDSGRLSKWQHSPAKLHPEAKLHLEVD